AFARSFSLTAARACPTSVSGRAGCAAVDCSSPARARSSASMGVSLTLLARPRALQHVLHRIVAFVARVLVERPPGGFHGPCDLPLSRERFGVVDEDFVAQGIRAGACESF